MEGQKDQAFQSLSTNVGTFSVQGKTLLIPEMNRIGCHLLAAVFQGFGVRAEVMETYQGLDLGREFTSGKECFPAEMSFSERWISTP